MLESSLSRRFDRKMSALNRIRCHKHGEEERYAGLKRKSFQHLTMKICKNDQMLQTIGWGIRLDKNTTRNTCLWSFQCQGLIPSVERALRFLQCLPPVLLLLRGGWQMWIRIGICSSSHIQSGEKVGMAKICQLSKKIVTCHIEVGGLDEFSWINCCQAFLFGTLALVRAWLGGPGVLLPSSLELSHFCRNFQRRGLGFMLNLKFCPFCGLRVPCGTIVGSITDQSELGMSTNACGQRCQAGLVTKVIWRKASWRWY